MGGIDLVFSSLTFWFFYLPCVLLLYYAVPLKARNLALFLVSIAFYGWGEPVLVLLMLLTIMINPQDRCRKGFAHICEKAGSRGRSSQVEAGHPSLPSTQEPWSRGVVRLTRLPHHHSI